MAQRDKIYDAIFRTFIQEQGGHVVLVSKDYGFASLLRSMFKTLGLGRTQFFRMEEPAHYIKAVKNILDQSSDHQVLLFIETNIQGKTFYDELRMTKQAFGEQCRIICLSPEISAHMTAFAMESGADNMIVKPISMNSLMQKIANTVQPNNMRKLVSRCGTV